MRHARLARAAFAVAPLLIPAVGPALSAQRAPSGGAIPAPTRFTVRVENVSKPTTLKLSSGGTVAVPVSPGTWAVHTGGNPLLTLGQVEPGLGLKGLAEAGMAAAFAPNISGVAGVRKAGFYNEPIAPAAGAGGMVMTAADSAMAAARPRMLRSGYHFAFTIEAVPGDRLSIAMMVSQSNDGLIATGPDGIALFDKAGQPISGNVTAQLLLLDAGTEVNEEPGIGRNQGLRQGAPHAGDPERRPVRLMSEAEFGGAWPAVGQIIRVTLESAKR